MTVRATLCVLGLPVAFSNGVAVRLIRKISAGVLVWLAAALVVVETFPASACACGNHREGPAKRSALADSQLAAAACPHCRPQPQRSCCGGGVAGQPRSSCCMASTTCSCCCGNGTSTSGHICQCAKDHSAPTPAPGDSQSNSGKSSVSASMLVGSLAVPLVDATLGAHSEHWSCGRCSSVPERLSILCRLTI
jgi:hypothetical protein